MGKTPTARLALRTSGSGRAMSCDIRVASTKPNPPNQGKAMELMLTGDMISAEEALALGLVNHVYPPEELEAKPMELANRIADMSSVALAMVKASVKNAARMSLREGLDSEVDLFSLYFSSEDKEEGVRAFIEKRKAEFKGNNSILTVDVECLKICSHALNLPIRLGNQRWL